MFLDDEMPQPVPSVPADDQAGSNAGVAGSDMGAAPAAPEQPAA